MTGNQAALAANNLSWSGSWWSHGPEVSAFARETAGLWRDGRACGELGLRDPAGRRCVAEALAQVRHLMLTCPKSIGYDAGDADIRLRSWDDGGVCEAERVRV